MSGTRTLGGPLRVVIVEDSDLMAVALRQLYEEGEEARVVAHETHGEAAIRTIVDLSDECRPRDLL
jgi:DNA-binding NarL/FixJ family response regulator